MIDADFQLASPGFESPCVGAAVLPLVDVDATGVDEALDVRIA
jgi:hypothetical protein